MSCSTHLPPPEILNQANLSTDNNLSFLLRKLAKYASRGNDTKYEKYAHAIGAYVTSDVGSNEKTQGDGVLGNLVNTFKNEPGKFGQVDKFLKRYLRGKKGKSGKRFGAGAASGSGFGYGPGDEDGSEKWSQQSGYQGDSENDGGSGEGTCSSSSSSSSSSGSSSSSSDDSRSEEKQDCPSSSEDEEDDDDDGE